MNVRIKGLATVLGRAIISHPDTFIITASGAKLTDTRTSAWTNTVTHEFSVTWQSDAERTSFFNNGGQIRISGSRVGGTSSIQNESWDHLFSTMGIVIFDVNGTSATGTGVGSALTVDSLTSTYQTIFSRNSGLTGLYSTDTYVISARKTATSLFFRITHSDSADGTVDTPVDGVITSLIDERRFTADDSPVYTTITSMTGGS